MTLGLFFDERANERQREALQTVFTGQGGGFMANLAKLVSDIRGIEYVPISFAVADDLAYWRAEIPGKVKAAAPALTGPMTPPGKRVQLLNPPGSEKGTRPDRYLGRSDRQPGQCSWLSMELGRKVQQAYSVRLDRPLDIDKKEGSLDKVRQFVARISCDGLWSGDEVPDDP